MRLRRGTSYRSVAGGGIEGAVEGRFLRCLFTLYTRVGAFTNQVYSVLTLCIPKNSLLKQRCDIAVLSISVCKFLSTHFITGYTLEALPHR